MNERESTAWPELDLEGIQRAMEGGDCSRLTECLFRAMKEGFPAGGVTREAEDLLGEFCADYTSRNRGEFWRTVLNRCESNTAVVVYVKRCFANFCAKHPSGDRLVFSEREWFRRRVRILLHAAPFRADRTPCGQVHGLAAWREGVAQRGVYEGEWTEFEDACRNYPPFQRQDVSDRRGPYADSQITDGLQRLLSISHKFSTAKVLAQGIERYWAQVTTSAIFSLAEADRPARPSDDPATREIVDLALAQLTDRQRYVLLNYTLPKALKSPGHPGPTLAELARRMRVSIETVRLESEAALARVRAVFESQALTHEEYVACGRMLLECAG